MDRAVSDAVDVLRHLRAASVTHRGSCLWAVVLPLSVRSASADAVVDLEGQLVLAHPITGHAHYGEGATASARVALMPEHSSLFGLAADVDLDCSEINSSGECWLRGLVGVRIAPPIARSTVLAIDALVGTDALVLGMNPGLFLATAISAGPHYEQHGWILGAVVGLIYTSASEDTQGGQFPDRSGTLLTAGVVVGRRWQ